MITAQIKGRSISIADRRYDSDAFAVLLDYLRLPSLAIDGNPVNSSGDIAGLRRISQLIFPIGVGSNRNYAKENGGCDFVFLATLPQLPDGILAPSIFVEPLKRLANITFSFASEDELVYLVSMESDENHDGLFGVPLKGLGFEYLQDAATRAPLSLDVHAEIDIGSTPIQIAINVPLGAPSGPKVLTVTSPSMVPLENGLAEIVQFIEKVAGIPSASRTFPDSLESISTFFLDEFTLLLDPDSLHIDFLTFRLISAQPLALIPNHLSIENTGVRLNITPGRENDPTTHSTSPFLARSTSTTKPKLKSTSPCHPTFALAPGPSALPAMRSWTRSALSKSCLSRLLRASCNCMKGFCNSRSSRSNYSKSISNFHPLR